METLESWRLWCLPPGDLHCLEVFIDGDLDMAHNVGGVHVVPKCPPQKLVLVQVHRKFCVKGIGQGPHGLDKRVDHSGTLKEDMGQHREPLEGAADLIQVARQLHLPLLSDLAYVGERCVGSTQVKLLASIALSSAQ